jgi:hypothetical protein
LPNLLKIAYLIIFFTSTDFSLLRGYPGEVVEPLVDCIFIYLFHFYRVFAFGCYHSEVVESFENCNFFFTSTDFLLLGGSPGEVAEPLED